MNLPAGIGKTWFSMCMALAASHGKELFSNCKDSWKAPKPRRVVYIDSEMTEYHFKKRLQILSQMYQSEYQNLSFKLVAEENMNLADGDSGYCDQITQWLNDEADAGRPVDLLVLDNLSTLPLLFWLITFDCRILKILPFFVCKLCANCVQNFPHDNKITSPCKKIKQFIHLTSCHCSTCATL